MWAERVNLANAMSIKVYEVTDYQHIRDGHWETVIIGWAVSADFPLVSHQDGGNMYVETKEIVRFKDQAEADEAIADILACIKSGERVWSAAEFQGRYSA
jgi:hypothetical protein